MAQPVARALLRELEAVAQEPRTEPRYPGAPAFEGYRAHARPAVRDPRDDARALFEVGGGKMMGVLVAQDAAGASHHLRAFSGMYAGRWDLPGWAPPVFDSAVWYALEAQYDPHIAALGARISSEGRHARDVQARASASAQLMARYLDLVQMSDRRGRSLSLVQALGDKRAAASGMGDCCGPKLLTQAQRRGWRAVAMAEFFVGAARRPGGREHAKFYAPCAEKCGPILGALLCGARASA